jgi:hypothetical protein
MPAEIFLDQGESLGVDPACTKKNTRGKLRSSWGGHEDSAGTEGHHENWSSGAVSRENWFGQLDESSENEENNLNPHHQQENQSCKLETADEGITNTGPDLEIYQHKADSTRNNFSIATQ